MQNIHGSLKYVRFTLSINARSFRAPNIRLFEYIYIFIHNLVQKTTRAPNYLPYICPNGSINKFILAAKPVILLSINLALSSHGYLSRSNTIIHVHFRVQTQNLMYREASALIHIFNNLTNRIWFVFF